MSMASKERVTITVDGELLERIDCVASQRGDSRSALIERMLQNEIGPAERFVRDMESPIKRAILRTITSKPQLVEMIAALVGDHLDSDEAEKISRSAKEQAELGMSRNQEKKSSAARMPGVEPA